MNNKIKHYGSIEKKLQASLIFDFMIIIIIKSNYYLLVLFFKMNIIKIFYWRLSQNVHRTTHYSHCS